MKGVTYQKVPSIENEKGITVEWCKGIPGKQVSIYYRNAGQSFADHYHTGADSSKKPERFFLISGKVSFFCEDMKSKETTSFILTSGMELLIEPFIYHKAEALEDSIFLEYRMTEFNPKDSDTLLNS